MTVGLLNIINYISDISNRDRSKNKTLKEIHRITKTLVNIYIQNGMCPDMTPAEVAEWLHKETI